MSKPIYPLSFPTQTSNREAIDSASTVLSEDDTSTPQWEAHRWSSASSSVDFADVSEPFESESFGQSYVPSDTFKCGLCERFLSQRSPWSSRRIVRSGDMPVVGVLSCRHVFHAECLEQTTPKTQKSDPSCPICLRLQEENSPDQQVFSRLKNSFPRLRQSCDNGQSRPWGCPLAGGCVEGASHVPPRNTVLLLNRNRVKKNLSLKGNSSKEFPGKLRKTGACSSQLFNGKTIDPVVGCAKTTAGPSMRRWCWFCWWMMTVFSVSWLVESFRFSQIEFWRMWLEIHSIASLLVLDVWWKHINWTCDFYVTTMLYWDLRLMGLVANRIWISVELPSSAQTGSPLGLKPYGQSPCNMFVNSQWKVLVLIIFPSSYGQALSIIWVVVNTPLVQSFSVHMSSSRSEFLVFNFHSQPRKKKMVCPQHEGIRGKNQKYPVNLCIGCICGGYGVGVRMKV